MKKTQIHLFCKELQNIQNGILQLHQIYQVMKTEFNAMVSKLNLLHKKSHLILFFDFFVISIS